MSAVSQTQPNTAAKRLVLLCALVYFFSYLSRYNFGAAMLEIAAAEGYGKPAVAMAVTGLFIVYGVMQIVSGYLGDIIAPRRLIAGGLMTAAAMNALVPFCPDPVWMTVVWCINGAAQSMIWPPLVRLLAGALSPSAYQKATVRVLLGGNLGSVAVYLITPFVMYLSGGWHLAFYVPAVCAAVMSVVFYLGTRGVSAAPPSPSQQEDAPVTRSRPLPLRLAPVALLALLAVAIVAQGLVRDGVTAWLPTYMADNFGLHNRVSILTGVGIPLLVVLTLPVAAWINGRFVRNEPLSAALFFAGGTVLLAALWLVGGTHWAVALVCLTLACVCTHGVNMMLIGMVPLYFKPFGRTALFSGGLNMATYVGSALSTYGVAVIIGRYGWDTAVPLWLVVALVGTVCAAVAAPLWARYVARFFERKRHILRRKR